MFLCVRREALGFVSVRCPQFYDMVWPSAHFLMQKRDIIVVTYKRIEKAVKEVLVGLQRKAVG